MKKINPIVFALFLSLAFKQSALAGLESLHIMDADIAMKTSYVSAEFNSAIPFWVIEGRLVTLGEARDFVLNQDKVACVSWLMNYSNNSEVKKDEIQKTLFVYKKSLPLWKKINEKAIFVDEASGFAVSYNCLKRSDSSGSLEEIEALTNSDFNFHFRGIMQITDL